MPEMKKLLTMKMPGDIINVEKIKETVNMLYEKIPLSETDSEIYLEAFVAEKINGYTRRGILVIPGGGYGCICHDREGEPIAQAFMPYGFNSFVLHYSVGAKAKFPRPLIEASKAIKHIKDNAEKYNIDPDKVFVTGFSAGGHLTAATGTLWHMKEIYDEIPMEYGYNKPTAVIPVYPVISGEKFGHLGSFKNILASETPSEDELKKYSLERCVDKKTVPMFLVHTATDELVNVKNSICMANALAENGVPFELHIFEDSPHGMALGNEITACGKEKWNSESLAAWVDMAAKWAKKF